MRRVLIFVAGAFAVAVGCTKQPAVCTDGVKEYEQALAASGAGTCKTDADCKCYNGGISDKQPCGGVSDTKTAEKLTSIAEGFGKAQCRSGINCGAWVCTPACDDGKCTTAAAVISPASAPAPVPSAPPTAAPAEGGAATCGSRLADIERVIASASNKCATDKDCVCFRGGVSNKDACGGITDKQTNERFEALAKDWTAAGCKNDGVMCAAWICDPACNSGTCGRRAGKPAQ